MRESFSKELNSTHQIAFDSTSLGTMTCARKYEYSIVRGYIPPDTAVDLDFGLKVHSAKEDFALAVAGGADHNEATEFAVSRTLARTWDTELQKPWYTGHPNKNRGTLIRSIAWYLD